MPVVPEATWRRLLPTAYMWVAMSWQRRCASSACFHTYYKNLLHSLMLFTSEQSMPRKPKSCLVIIQVLGRFVEQLL